ncbi:unnamed protein product [Heligmosomoides polygyrus]|uniref:Uncharacterized protein n=1 Tax=Heligmosomoides polygyrus TaxID=6339 RepID=A0A183F7V1_HELPZ|nr:unnamed protein product [Heligmosomoides polygyrus]
MQLEPTLLLSVCHYRDKSRENPCYNCGNDIECVLKRQYDRLMGGAQTPSVRHTVEDAHFAPQSWHCELRDNLRKYKVIRYTGADTNSMWNELEIEFSTRGVPQDILTDIRSQVSRNRTFHQTYNSHARHFYERQIRTSPKLMKLLVKMFFYDYLLFGFPLPDIR